MPISLGFISYTLTGTRGLKLPGLFFLSILSGFTVFIPDKAKADFRVCNDTKSLIGVSLGFSVSGSWTTEGWWQIPGETCASLLEGDLDSRFYYIYAEDADRGGQWRGDIFMCTADQEFKIDGVQDCFTRGYEKTGFFEIDTSNRNSWMVRLTESGRTSSQPKKTLAK